MSDHLRLPLSFPSSQVFQCLFLLWVSFINYRTLSSRGCLQQWVLAFLFFLYAPVDERENVGFLLLDQLLLKACKGSQFLTHTSWVLILHMRQLVDTACCSVDRGSAVATGRTLQTQVVKQQWSLKRKLIRNKYLFLSKVWFYKCDFPDLPLPGLIRSEIEKIASCHRASGCLKCKELLGEKRLHRKSASFLLQFVVLLSMFWLYKDDLLSSLKIRFPQGKCYCILHTLN